MRKKRDLNKLLICICSVLLIGAAVTGCGKEEASGSVLYGTWEAEEGVASYQFFDDGTGYSYVKSNPDITVDFTYTIEDDIVTIQRTGSDSKAQLAISEENGEIVLYNKNKHDERIVKKP